MSPFVWSQLQEVAEKPNSRRFTFPGSQKRCTEPAQRVISDENRLLEQPVRAGRYASADFDSFANVISGAACFSITSSLMITSLID
jgi:hypothetical protein